MRCHYCGRSVGIAAVTTGESDFCGSDHRARFHARLAKGLALIGRECARPDTAAAIVQFMPVDSAPRAAGTAQFVHPLRLPSACVAIVAEPRLVPAPQREASRSLPRRESKGPMAKLDRITALGLRLGDLRVQLERASMIPGRLSVG